MVLIQTLLLTLPTAINPLVEAKGRVYIAMPPSLPRCPKGKGRKEEVAYAWTDGELRLAELSASGAFPFNIGLGEMNADQLWKPL